MACNLKCTIITQRMEKFLACIFCNHFRHCIGIRVENLQEEEHKQGNQAVKTMITMGKLTFENARQYLRYASNNPFKLNAMLSTVREEIGFMKLHPVQQSLLLFIINGLTFLIQSIQVQVYPGNLHCSRIDIKPIHLQKGCLQRSTRLENPTGRYLQI